MKYRAEDYIGQKFGKWEVIAKAEGKRNKVIAFCGCGKTVRTLILGILIRGESKCCGCDAQAEFSIKATKHGLSRTAEYRILQGMKQRCYNPNQSEYFRYGGREPNPIVVCDRWLNGEEGKVAIECFLDDMGKRPTLKHSIDRIDGDGNYEPNNCRWATDKEQSRNLVTNRILHYKGKNKCLAEWAEEFKIPRKIVWNRLHLGWSIEDALERPVVTTKCFVEYQNEANTLTVWSEILNLPKGMLYDRINRYGWSIKEAFETPCRGSETMLTYNGETHNMKTWSEIKGMDKKSVSRRLKMGWTLEDTLETPIKSQTKKNT